jgi:hypothetical protein
MLRAPAWALLCGLAVGDGLLGCDTSCDKENEDPWEYRKGRTSPSCTSYQTNAFDEEYVLFPKGRRVLVRHGLGPVGDRVFQVKSYLAFDPNPLGEAMSNTAESAGNQVLIEEVTDEWVVVRNDTCEKFYLRLVVEADSADPACLNPGQAGAGGAASAGGAAGAGG